MKNKVIVKIIVPSLDETFDIFLPCNKKIGKTIELIGNYLKGNTDGVFEYNEHIELYNRDTGEIYDPNVIVKNTNIRNGTELILI